MHDRGVGPPPIPVDEFSLHKLEDAINFMLDDKVNNNMIIGNAIELTNETEHMCTWEQVKSSAETLAKAMKDEDGVAGAVKAFFKHLPSTKQDLQESISEPSGFLSLRQCFGCS